jgi:hypothetical protein
VTCRPERVASRKIIIITNMSYYYLSKRSDLCTDGTRFCFSRNEAGREMSYGRTLEMSEMVFSELFSTVLESVPYIFSEYVRSHTLSGCPLAAPSVELW